MFKDLLNHFYNASTLNKALIIIAVALVIAAIVLLIVWIINLSKNKSSEGFISTSTKFNSPYDYVLNWIKTAVNMR